MRNALILILALVLGNWVTAQEKPFQLSTHILDISEGMPAENVLVKLEKLDDLTEKWHKIAEKRTMENGRINDFLPISDENTGVYRFTFYTAAYFKRLDKDTFYPFIEVVFKIEDSAHYHVPITLSAFGYSTYRGS